MVTKGANDNKDDEDEEGSPGCDTLTKSISVPPQTFRAFAGRVHQVAAQPDHGGEVDFWS